MKMTKWEIRRCCIRSCCDQTNNAIISFSIHWHPIHICGKLTGRYVLPTVIGIWKLCKWEMKTICLSFFPIEYFWSDWWELTGVGETRRFFLGVSFELLSHGIEMANVPLHCSCPAILRIPAEIHPFNMWRNWVCTDSHSIHFPAASADTHSKWWECLAGNKPYIHYTLHIWDARMMMIINKYILFIVK